MWQQSVNDLIASFNNLLINAVWSTSKHYAKANRLTTKTNQVRDITGRTAKVGPSDSVTAAFLVYIAVTATVVFFTKVPGIDITQCHICLSGADAKL